MLDRITPEEWKRIRTVAGLVLDADPADRTTILERECAGDTRLLEHVERILNEYSETDDLMGREPFAPLPREREGLSAGDRVGAYAIERELGRGSMGRVYLAHRADDAFSKTVAIKVIRFPGQAMEELFRAERRILAKLEHAHIARLHDAGSSPGGGLYLVMEYVDGVPLDAYCREAKLDLNARLRLFLLVTDAVVYAHRQGVRHSDLKPSNILVNREGSPKLLDFGISALQGESSRGFSPLYSSPEQKRGEASDERADIYSLGAVLRTLLPQPAPQDLGSVVDRAQAELPAERYATAQAFAADLERFLLRRPVEAHDGSWLYRTVKLAQRHPRSLGLVAVMALAGTTGLGWMWATRPELLPNAVHVEQLSGLEGREAYPSMSPDGRTVAFANRSAGKWNIYVQSQPQLAPRNITAQSGFDDTHPAWSPDGRRIAFRSERDGGGIFVMDADGGNVRKLCAGGFHPAWSPDGRTLAYSTAAFVRMRATTFLRRSQILTLDTASPGTPLAVTTEPLVWDAVQPAWSPSGARLAFWGTDKVGVTYIYTAAAQGTPAKPLVAAQGGPAKSVAGRVWSPVWSTSGRHLYYSSDQGGTTTLWRVPLDEASGELRGQPVRLPLPVAEAGSFSLSRDGRRLAYTIDLEAINLEKIAFDPTSLRIVGSPTSLTSGQNNFARPRISPDGHDLVFESNAKEDVWLSRADGTNLRRLTEEKGTFPRFVDADTIGFISHHDDRFEAVTMRVDGSQRASWTVASKESITLKWFSPGRLLVAVPTQQRYYFQKPGAAPEPFPNPAPPDHTLSFSPSASGEVRLLGRLIPLKRRQDARAMIYDTLTHQVTDLGVKADDAIELFDHERFLLYKDHAHVFRVLDRQTGENVELFHTGQDEVIGVDLSKDRRWLYYSRSKSLADVWIAEMSSPL